jgi:hypothetical protein
MTTVGDQYMTLTDYANRLDPNGAIAEIAEVLQETNEILDDMIWKEGNLTTGEKHTIRTGLPSVTWRELYGGIQPSKSTTRQVVDTCGAIEALSKVDVGLIELSANEKATRATEDDAFVESMSQELGTSLFYYSIKTDPEKITGFTPRYNQLPTLAKHDDFRDNVITGAGSGSVNTSIWLVCWGPRSVFGIFPKNTKTGLQQEDLGKQLVTADGGGEYLAYVTHFKWLVGLAIKNWKYVARICNIDVTTLKEDLSSGADIIKLMIKAYYKIPRANQGSKMVFYANNTIAEFLHQQARNKTNVNLTLDTVDGKPITKCLGIPIKRCDALLNTESAVAA